MTAPTAFFSKPDFWEKNESEARDARASPAERRHPDGNRHPGVVIMRGPYPVLVMDPQQAIRLATEIADALEATKGHQ